MKQQKYEISKEAMECNRIKELYNLMLTDGGDKNFREKLVKELLLKQKEDGSWSVIETRECDSDIRVHYIYFPTYHATAALMCADLYEKYADSSVEKQALLKGLKIAGERKLMGHGFDATRQMLDALCIYKIAGLYRWIQRDDNSQNAFCDIIHERIELLKDNVKIGKTISDWNVDFRDAYEREIKDYDAAVQSYVWYACYGSNLCKERFMRYINNCSDRTPPVEDRPFLFDHNIYFAKTAHNWQNGGKAFLDDSSDGLAYGRIYKITKVQFEELKRQEGADYTKKLDLGSIDGIPVYSFTDVQKNLPLHTPSREYFETILKGLNECYDNLLTDGEQINYLIASIFPESTFVVARAIKESEHCISNKCISEVTGVNQDTVITATGWLVEHNLIQQDRRSVRAGHRLNELDAQFFTVESSNARDLIFAIIEVISKAKADGLGEVEGARHYVLSSRIERSSLNRVEAVRLHGYKCQACGFDFEKTYGSLGKNYIEVHHINPLASCESEQKVNPKTDLVCLCANCHRMVHRSKHQVLSLDDLRKLLVV